MLRNLVVRNACRNRPSIQVARGLCRHQTRRLMASSPQFGRNSNQEKTAGFIMGILSMAGALYFIAPNRKPLFASRKVESDKTAEEELSSGGEQSPENGNDNDSNNDEIEAGAQLGGDKIGASKVAEDGELVVLAEEDDKSSGDKETDESQVNVPSEDGEQSNEGNDASEEEKDKNASAESSEENTNDRALNNGTESSEENDFKHPDDKKLQQKQSDDRATTQEDNGEDKSAEQNPSDSEKLTKQTESSDEDKEELRKQEEKQMGPTEEEVQHEGAYNPDTGEINWDCPCLGGMAHGPCGEEFKSAFSCFVYSEAEPKGIDCVEKFQHMQDCFRKHPEHYAEQLKETSDDEESQDKAKTNTIESAPNVSSAKENAAKKAEQSDVKKEPLNEESKS
ncbi:Mia40p [Saccharomyces paradoxus]|uniref:Mitochondrial intermembrane space import and assembly protein 40 n=1 Tax=Saccharomyces paradoxus TaxID=27291 RepID=A0A8B8UUP7_SACPA|nr:Mia40 [Saccharomyces paradoxus]QHS74409.1 Mia40 [Saccharomyces paradoxus]